MIALAIGSTILFCFWARIRANGDLAAKLLTKDEAADCREYRQAAGLRCQENAASRKLTAKFADPISRNGAALIR
jgi:hypothetical protein